MGNLRLLASWHVRMLMLPTPHFTDTLAYVTHNTTNVTSVLYCRRMYNVQGRLHSTGKDWVACEWCVACLETLVMRCRELLSSPVIQTSWCYYACTACTVWQLRSITHSFAWMQHVIWPFQLLNTVRYACQNGTCAFCKPAWAHSCRATQIATFSLQSECDTEAKYCVLEAWQIAYQYRRPGCLSQHCYDTVRLKRVWCFHYVCSKDGMAALHHVNVGPLRACWLTVWFGLRMLARDTCQLEISADTSRCHFLSGMNPMANVSDACLTHHAAEHSLTWLHKGPNRYGKKTSMRTVPVSKARSLRYRHFTKLCRLVHRWKRVSDMQFIKGTLVSRGKP